MKHASASQININFEQTKHKLKITIRDNGLGFDTRKQKQAPAGQGFQNDPPDWPQQFQSVFRFQKRQFFTNRKEDNSIDL